MRIGAVAALRMEPPPVAGAPFGAGMSAERFEVAAVEFGRSADALTTRSKEQVEEQPERKSHATINEIYSETYNSNGKNITIGQFGISIRHGKKRDK